MVGLSDRAADASGWRSRAQSGCRAARAGARQRYISRAAVSSDHAGEHRRLGDSRQAASVSDPCDPGRSDGRRKPAADRVERRPSRRAGAASAGIRAGSFRHLYRLLSAGGRSKPLPTGFAGVGSSRRSGATARDPRTGPADRRRLQHRIPHDLAGRFATLGRRACPRGARRRRQPPLPGRRLLRHHGAQDRRNRTRDFARPAGGRAHARWPN